MKDRNLVDTLFSKCQIPITNKLARNTFSDGVIYKKGCGPDLPDEKFDSPVILERDEIAYIQALGDEVRVNGWDLPRNRIAALWVPVARVTGEHRFSVHKRSDTKTPLGCDLGGLPGVDCDSICKVFLRQPPSKPTYIVSSTIKYRDGLTNWVFLAVDYDKEAKITSANGFVLNHENGSVGYDIRVEGWNEGGCLYERRLPNRRKLFLLKGTLFK